MLIILCILGYVLGSISISYMLGKLQTGIDIREHGSGNAGTTNALRVFGIKIGVLTLIFDFLKGFLPVYFLSRYYIFPEEPIKAIIVGVCIVLGHNFSFMLNFKGGKGVATSIGVLFALFPKIAFFAVLSFILIVILSKIVSLASVGTAIWIMIYYLYNGIKYNSYPYLIIAGLALLIIIRHKENIKRILKGEENKITVGKGTVK